MHNHATKNYQCPFCLLVQGIQNEFVESIYTDIICQNDAVTAFIGSYQWPRNPGNVIIVPNKHYENIFDLPLHLAAEIHDAARIIAMTMKRVYQCDGISTRQHNEPAGSQDVWHYHLHITPRFHNDRLYQTLATEGSLMLPDERAWHAQQLKAQLLA